jgi:hypothetical protein
MEAFDDIPAAPRRTFGGDSEYKRIFQEGYNEVADKAKGRRDPRIARVLMEKLGYDRADLDIIGTDVNQMQGTGNPHAFAKIKAGEICLDLGSGLGVDAFLAAHRVGKEGKVIGLDLSEKVGGSNHTDWLKSISILTTVLSLSAHGSHPPGSLASHQASEGTTAAEHCVRKR